MTVTVEKKVTFDEKEWAASILDNLYDMLEDREWDCLTEEQQKTVVEEILTEAIRQVKEG
jgi:hypothetical protein